MKNQKTMINSGVHIQNLTDTKFKTMRISVNFILPLKEKTASAYAIVPSLITQATKEYPSLMLLSQRLSELYGANLSSSFTKSGDYQVLNINASSISDRFALENEDLTEILTNLICSAVFTPLVDENGEFLTENFKQEKRQLFEAMDADFNDKRTYSINQAMGIMFKGEPAQIKKYGSRESLDKLEREDAKKALKEILETANIEIMVLGDCNFDKVSEIFKSKFNFERSPIAIDDVQNLNSKELKEVTEEQNLAQSKLILGYKLGVDQSKEYIIRLMCVILGGSASSKFFLNVREKLSLCYYCSASPSTAKSAMFIESGIETANIEKAKTAILKEIEDVKNGIISDEELNVAKLCLLNAYRAVGDSLGATENWYVKQIFSKDSKSTDECMEIIKAITKEEIVDVAKQIQLDTIYVLKGVGNNE